MKATTRRPAWTVSYCSLWQMHSTKFCSSGPPGVISALHSIMGTIRVSEHSTHEDKNAVTFSPRPDFPNLGIYFACPEHSQGISFLEGAGGFQALPTVIVQMYLKGRRADLVPGVFPAFNLHGGANSTGKSQAAGKSTVCSSLQKRGRFFRRGAGCEAKFHITGKETASRCLIFPL